MDPNYEGNSFPDVDFKPGADYEVDDTLFQGMTMKEDFLDFGIANNEYVYCSTELEAQGRTGSIVDEGNEMEIQKDDAAYGDAAVSESSQPVKKKMRTEELKAIGNGNEGAFEDKKKAGQVPVVKTYNMRSKRLAVDDGKAESAGRNAGAKGGQLAKRQKVEQSRTTKVEETSDEEEDNEEDEEENEEENEDPDSEDEESPQSKRKHVIQSKKGAKAKGKRKAKAAKAKKTAKGKAPPKKSSKPESEEESDEEDEDEESVVAKVTKKSKASKPKGKVESGKRKSRQKRKQETDSSEEEENEDEEEEEEGDSESDEEAEVPQKSAKTKQKRSAKGKIKQPATKKKKPAKKSSKKAAPTSDSEATSSDNLPLQEIRKKNKTKAVKSSGKQKKVRKEESEENSTAEDDETESIQTGAEKGGHRDPILSALTKGSVVLTDDSASVCSNDDGTPGVRTSSRIKKPNRLYVTGNANSQPVEKTGVVAAQKKERQTKATDQPTANANLDVSETTDTDSLVIDISPAKFQISSMSGISKLQVSSSAEEKDAETEEQEKEEDGGRDDSKTDELGPSEGVKRSARLKHVEETNLEKFKALKAERERLEVKNDLQKRKSLEKVVESEVDKEENPKQVAKEAVKPSVSATAIKNPCRGPNCGNGSLPGSVYCSEICIQNHAEESIQLIEQERQKSQPQRSRAETTVAISKSEERVVVFERKTGKLLTGPVAPTESTLLAWLKKHPTFEVLQPSHHSSSSSSAVKKDKKPENKKAAKEVRIPLSKETAKASIPGPLLSRDPEQPPHGGVREEKMKSTVPGHTTQQPGPIADRNRPANIHRELGRATPRDMHGESNYSRGGPDPARISIRNTLRETLLARANETDDVMLSGPEIKRLALDIEQELFGYYGEVNTKYKHKYRTLITHLKDPKNKGLFRKVLFGEVKANRLVRLSSENLGSRELAFWKDPSAKRAQEKICEPKPPKKAEFALPPKSPFYDPSYDYLSSIIVDTTSNHGNHFFDINCKICTGKIPEPMYYEAGKTSSGNLVSSKEDMTSAAGTDVEPPVMAKLAKDDDYAPSAVGVSRDPRRSKAVIAPAPSGLSVSSAASKSEEKAAILSPPNVVSPPVSVRPTVTDISTGYRVGQVEPLALWRGAIYTHDVSKVPVSAYLVSGSLAVLKEDLSDLIVISGRLPPDNVYYYLSHIKQAGSFQRDVAVLRFEPASGQNEDLYNQLFTYLHSRDRCGVVSGCSGPTVKDVYIVPVASGHGLPSVLLPTDGPGLSENHPNLLLGVVMKHSSKRLGLSSPSGPVKPPPFTKTWMYSERMPENKEERGPETQHHGNRHGTKQIETDVVIMEKQSSVEELTPKRESRAAMPSRQDDVLTAESSGASDVDEDLSEVAQKDPIVSKYSKFEKKKPFRKPAFEIVLDDEKPYDPFDDEEDKPYDPSSPEFVPTTRAVTATDTVSASKSASSSTGNLTSSNALLPNPTSSLGGGVAVAPPVKPVGGASNTTDMTTAMLTTLAAISTTNNTEEQRRLFAELTDKINEQKLHLDKERQDLKNEESLGFLGPNSASKRNNSDNSETLQKLSSESLFQLLDGKAFAAKTGNIPGLSTTELSSTFGSASGEGSLANIWGNLSADHAMKSMPAAASNLSQTPIDSAAIMNLARKRLAQKAGDSHHMASKPENTSAELSADAKKGDLSTPADDAAPNGNELGTSAKSGVETNPSFSCNLSVLPPSIQQLLSGPSFENLKSIVANVTGKKTSGVDGSNAVKVEPLRYEKDDSTMANRFSDKELGLVRSRSGDTLSSEDLGRTGNYQTRFPSNTHGDVDYRFQPDPSDMNSSSYEDAEKHWNLQMPPGARVDPRTQSSHAPAFSMQKPTGPMPFRPSMQALLETPSDSMPRNSSEMKQPLLKTPQMPGAPDQSVPQPPFPPFMQPPPFPSKLSRPSFPAEMPGHQMLDSDDQQHQFQKGPLRPEVPRPPLLPDVPKPPFPPQLSRPPFPPGMPRQPFLPEPPPRPPVMPDHLRAPLSSRNEPVLPSPTFGNAHRPGSGLLPIPSPGTVAGKGQTDSSGKGQLDYSSPSDKYFVPQSAGPRNFPNTNDQSATESNKPFLVGDILKQLDNNAKTRQGSAAKTSSASAATGQNKPKISSQSSSEDANLRERKVLLPTPTTKSKQKSNEQRTSQNAAESASQERTQEKRELSENKKQEQKKSETSSSRTAVRGWSAKSDWETKKSDKAGSTDDGAKSLQQIELELIPLPPTRSPQDDQSGGCGTENENTKEDQSAQGKPPESKPEEDTRRSADKEKPGEGRRHSKQSPSDLSRSRSGEHGKFGAKKGAKDNSDSRVSDRGERRSRLQNRGRHSRDYSGRQRSRSKERPSSYHARSSDRRSDAEQQRRFSRGRRRASPLLDIRKRDGDRDVLVKERNSHDGHNKTGQMQSSPIVQTDMKPSILGIPPLLLMKEMAEPQTATAAIPSLLDIMGVSRNRVPQSRASSELKNGGGNVAGSAAPPGPLAMKYCLDYKHGSDLEGLRDCNRQATAPEPVPERPFDSQGMLEMTRQREFDRMPDSRDHRRPILPHHYPVDYQERRDIPIEMRDSGIGNPGMPPKRPLIDRPPVGDLHQPYAGEGDPFEGGANFPRAGYRFRSGSAEVDESINSRQWGEIHDVSQMKGEPMRMQSTQSQFPAAPNFERNPMMHNQETNEADGRLFNASAMKKSLLGDYPGMGQDPENENPDEVRKEGNNMPSEWHMPPSAMPEPYQTGGDGQQPSSLPPRPRFPRPMTGVVRPGNGPPSSQRHQAMFFDERGPRPRMPPPQFVGAHDRPVSESPPWRNPGPFNNRQPENNRAQSFLPAEGGSDMDGTVEKKTLLPMPDASDPVSSSPSEMFAGGPGPRPHHPMDGPPAFLMHPPGPGGRMPPRLPPQHRHAGGFPRGSRGPGMRPMAPGDPRYRGQLMR